VKYTRERQRLLSYAETEATRPREEAEESTGFRTIQKPACKIAITCVDSSGQQFEAELLIGPHRSGRALFGMLLMNAGQHDAAAQHEPNDCTANVVQTESDLTYTISSNTSGEAAIMLLESGQEQQGEVAVWVDIWNRRLPILKYTVAFTFLSGPISSEAFLIDWVEEGEEFYRWVQLEMNQLTSEITHSRDNTAFLLRLHPPGAAGDMLQHQALCYLEEVVPREGEGSLGMDESSSNQIMVKLCLRNVTHWCRKENTVWGGQQSIWNRAFNTGNANTSQVNPISFSSGKIWLDIHSTRLRILDYTLSYATALGVGSLGMNFLDWVVDEERFQEWIHAHHEAHLNTVTPPHLLNQVVILRDPCIKQNMMVVDCMIHMQTTCWPESPQIPSLISACIDMHIPGNMEGSRKQTMDQNDVRSPKKASL